MQLVSDLMREDRQTHHQRPRHAHPGLAVRLRRALRTRSARPRRRPPAWYWTVWPGMPNTTATTCLRERRYDGDPVRQRSDRTRRLGGGRAAGGGLPGHAQHRDPGEHRQVRRHLRRVVAQREGGHGGGHGRLLGGSPGARVHEARGPERGRRPLLLRRQHRRGGGHGDRLRRRPGHAQLPGRAGQPQLRQVRQDPRDRAVGQRGSQGIPQAGLRAERALRHSGALPHHHAYLALQEHGRAGRAARTASPSPR